MKLSKVFKASHNARIFVNIQQDDPVVVDKAPVGVQIVGWRFQDEEVLMATEVIAEVLAR